LLSGFSGGWVSRPTAGLFGMSCPNPLTVGGPESEPGGGAGQRTRSTPNSCLDERVVCRQVAKADVLAFITQYGKSEE